MKGGKLIGTGSSSCVLNPGIPCKRGKHLDKGRVTKLLFHKDAKNLSKYEEKQSNLISNINGYKEWAIIYDEFCSSPPYSVLEEYDREGIQECFKNVESHLLFYLSYVLFLVKHIFMVNLLYFTL